MRIRTISQLSVLVLAIIIVGVAAAHGITEDDEVEPVVFDHFSFTSDSVGAEYSELPAWTMEQAQENGFQVWGGCMPGMGYHAFRIDEATGEPAQPLVLFDANGKMVGMEFESLTEQPAPWEHLEAGHEGHEFEHWTLHIYWNDEPENTCVGAGE